MHLLSLKLTVHIWYQSQSKQSDLRERKMSDDKTLTKIPQFDGHYDHWSELMKDLLRAKGMWSLVDEGYDEPAEGFEMTAAEKKSLDEIKMKDHQVKHYLFQAIDRVVFIDLESQNIQDHLGFDEEKVWRQRKGEAISSPNLKKRF